MLRLHAGTSTICLCSCPTAAAPARHRRTAQCRLEALRSGQPHLNDQNVIHLWRRMACEEDLDDKHVADPLRTGGGWPAPPTQHCRPSSQASRRSHTHPASSPPPPPGRTVSYPLSPLRSTAMTSRAGTLCCTSPELSTDSRICGTTPLRKPQPGTHLRQPPRAAPAPPPGARHHERDARNAHLPHHHHECHREHHTTSCLEE